MAFITKSDYEDSIKENVLDDITESDDTKLDVATSRAVEEAKGYLNARYDIVNIFNKTGDNRNPIIVMYVIDMALYHLHTLINMNKTPKARKERYDKAIEWFKLVNAGDINPPDLPIPDDETKDYVLFGSNTKRNNQI